MNFHKKTALLTGATGGLGHAIARALAERGVSLILTGRRTGVLEPLAAELKAEAVECDLSQAKDVQRLSELAADVDILVCNAALPGSGTLSSFSVDEIDRALSVNLRSPIVLSRLIGERMCQRGEGHIVFISSLAGKVASGNGSIYSATKFGLRGFSFGLREDFHRHGVGVSCVSPGFVRDAGMFHESKTKLPPFVGTSSPEDVAQAVLKAIEHDRSEVSVAPPHVRAIASFSQITPGFSSKLQRTLGGDRIGRDMASGQAAKR